VSVYKVSCLLALLLSLYFHSSESEFIAVPQTLLFCSVLGLKVDLNQLKGIAVTDVGSSPQVIWYFPEEELPDTIQDRFAVLFQTKSKWKQEEIMPYVVNVAVSVQNASLLLTKHSRVHTVQGIKYYSSKHAK